MALCTPTLESRLSTWFNFMDANGDGVLNTKDTNIIVENMIRAYNATPETRAAIIEDHSKWWSRFDHLCVNKELKRDDYVSAFKALIEKDPDNLKAELDDFFCNLFNNMDQNKDEQISLEEFLAFYSAFGVQNKKIVTDIFRKIDVNHDGFVDRDEWVQANVNFFFRHDPNFDSGFLYNISRQGHV